MKILCETQVVNRELYPTGRRAQRSLKATLALGYCHLRRDRANPSQELPIPKDRELEVIHFPSSGLNKNNIVRYKIHDNILKCYTKFVQDGKATISFKNPPDDIMIKCDPIQLKGFLQAMRLGLDGREFLNLRLNALAATAIRTKSQPQTRMSIHNRSDYPSDGFPATLTNLRVTRIKLNQITPAICSLRHLTFLDLCDNQINQIPLALGDLNLTTLNLGGNRLDWTTCWKWVSNPNIRNSLLNLDLSDNKIAFFPPPLLKLSKLVTLKLNHNLMHQLPFSIRRLKELRYFHLSSNKLTSLPSSLNYMHFEVLDIWGNDFWPRKEITSRNIKDLDQRDDGTTTRVPSLFELACSAVTRYKISYTSEDLPCDIIDILEGAPQCSCGQLCIKNFVHKRAAPMTLLNTKHLVFSRQRQIYADVVFCGPHCLGRRQIMATL